MRMTCISREKCEVGCHGFKFQVEICIVNISEMLSQMGHWYGKLMMEGGGGSLLASVVWNGKEKKNQREHFLVGTGAQTD